MPVILGDKDSIDTWLDDPSTTKLQPLLSPYEKSDLVWYPVTSAIGKPTFDGPECIQQVRLTSFPFLVVYNSNLKFDLKSH
jgi:putative SOS response-associated peptidase YedK